MAVLRGNGMYKRHTQEARMLKLAQTGEKDLTRIMMKQTFRGADGTRFVLKDQFIECGAESRSLSGVHAEVLPGSELEARVTATRLLLIGIFAFAFKKKKGGEKYLLIEGPDFAWMSEVSRKQVSEAMHFAVEVNNRVKQREGRPAFIVPKPDAEPAIETTHAAAKPISQHQQASQYQQPQQDQQTEWLQQTPQYTQQSQPVSHNIDQGNQVGGYEQQTTFHEQTLEQEKQALEQQKRDLARAQHDFEQRKAQQLKDLERREAQLRQQEQKQLNQIQHTQKQLEQQQAKLQKELQKLQPAKTTHTLMIWTIVMGAFALLCIIASLGNPSLWSGTIFFVIVTLALLGALLYRIKKMPKINEAMPAMSKPQMPMEQQMSMSPMPVGQQMPMSSTPMTQQMPHANAQSSMPTYQPVQPIQSPTGEYSHSQHVQPNQTVQQPQQFQQPQYPQQAQQPQQQPQQSQVWQSHQGSQQQH
ncbi:hypothetical protein D2E26_0423 [Bifidobacterium dolichotidis]|uniref:Uncharacterized protein n=1 Tax=Bifidobacterium dolichotidis TaxID=2306976 RepID=A0A430FSN2_9BIFI|nr:hypothetical protein [Bifidobacterium dolichotidis]RSX55860.1 hypothetical protein D2E26_0423 [Bifidobacterium dolichotidis]